MKPKKAKKRHKRTKMVTYRQAMALVVLMFISQGLCGYLLYMNFNPPHFTTDKTYLSVFEVDCLVHEEGTYCCKEPWLNSTNLSNPDFGWVETSDCVKLRKTS